MECIDPGKILYWFYGFFYIHCRLITFGVKNNFAENTYRGLIEQGDLRQVVEVWLLLLEVLVFVDLPFFGLPVP